MKKILFVCYGLGLGGIEKCFVNLLNSLSVEKYAVDVLLMNPIYTLKPQVYGEVNFLDTFSYVLNIEDTISEVKKRKSIFKKIDLLFSYCIFRIKIKLRLKPWTVFKKAPKHYDIAVSYSQNDYSAYYVIDKVCADKKIMWYHNGAYEKNEKHFARDKKYYHSFDTIVAVSHDCAKMLDEKFSFKEKLIVLKNIYNCNDIIERSKEFVPFRGDDGRTHIVTVGRLTAEKGADIAVDACRRLTSEMPDICWHWIGDGNQRSTIEKMVKEYGIEKNFIFEGDQVNPYPYMRCADIYVQPSYYEAYSTTVTEARILKKLIVTTDVGGMRQQLKDGANGVIVPVCSDKIADAVRDLIHCSEKRDEIMRSLVREDMSAESIIEEYERTVFGGKNG